MANSSAIKAGQAFVELFGDDSKLVKTLESAKKKLQTWGKDIKEVGSKLMMLGGSITAPMMAAAEVFGHAGEALNNMSKRTGVAVETLSAMGYAASMCDVDIATLETGLKKMSKFIVAAAGGSKEAKQALKDLGLTLADLNGLDPAKQFQAILDKVGQLQNPLERTTKAMEIFGKAGTALLPLAGSMGQFMQQAKDLGLVMSTSDAEAAEEFQQSIKRLWFVITSCVKIIGSALVPDLKDTANWLLEVARGAANWLRNNKDLIATIFRVAAGISAAGAGLMILGEILTGIGTVVGMIASLVPLIPIALGLMAAKSFISLDNLGKTFHWLGDTFGDLVKFAKDSFGGIADALKAGDIELAATIIWDSLKLIWIQGVDKVMNVWYAFRNGFADIFSSLGTILLDVGGKLVDTAIIIGTKIGTALLNAARNSVAMSIVIGGQYEQQVKLSKENEADRNAIKNNKNLTEAQKQHALDVNDAAYEKQKENLYNLQMAQRKNGAGFDTEMYKQIEVDLKNVWSSPIPSLDTKKFTDSLKGIGLTPEQQAALKASQEEIDKAKAELEALNRKAHEEAGKIPDRGMPGRKAEGNEDDLNIPSKQTIISAGTFNGSMVWGLGGAGVAERIAQSTERTARNTDKLTKQNNVPVYA